MDPTQQAQQLAMAMQTMIRQMAPLTAAMSDLQKTVVGADGSTRRFTADQKILAKLSEDEKQAYTTLATSLRVLAADIKKLHRELEDASLSEERRTEITDELNRLEKQRTGVSTQMTTYARKAGVQLGNLEQKSGTAAKALAVMGNAALIFTKGINDQIKTGSGTIVGYGSNFVEAAVKQQLAALKRGIPVHEFAETAAANRALVDAMGGTENMMNSIDGPMQKLWFMTTNMGESMRVAASMASDLAYAGIEPTSQAVDQYYGRLNMLSRLTGMSAAQTQQAISSMIKSESMQTLLLRAKVSERGAIIDSREALLNNIVAMTGSTDAAKKMIDEVNKMATAKPLDRIAQVARLRAYAGSMGVQLDPNALRGILSGHPDANQTKAITQMQMALTHATNQRMGGSLSQQLVTSQMLQGLHLDSMLNAGAFETTGQPVMGKGAQALAAQANAADSAYKQNGTTLEWLTKVYLQSDKILSQFGTTIGELTGGNSAASVVAGVGGLLMAKPLTKMGSTALGKAGQWLGNKSTIVDKAGGMLGKSGLAADAEALAPTASKLSMGAKGGLIGMLGGAGLDIAGTYLKNNGHKELGSAASMGGTVISDAATGAMVGSLLGPIGTAVGGLLGGAYGAYAGYKANYSNDSAALPAGPDRTKESASKTDAAEKKTATDLTQISTHTAQQTKQMDTNNATLMQLAKNSQAQLDIAKAQMALALSADKDKTKQKISTMMNGSDFSAVYNYIH